MEEVNASSLNLNSNETRHVYSALGNKKELSGVLNILWVVLGAFIGFFIVGLSTNIINESSLLIIVFLAITAVFSVLFIFLSKRAKKRTITHIIIDTNGITFMRRNGETFFYSMEQYINLRVTRHYYNGAYTGSSHSLLFRNAKGKQDEIQLGNMDKDLISTMFDDISCMKETGHFFINEIKPAMNMITNTAPNPDGTPAEMSDTTVTAQIDPNYPFGLSPVDGRCYRHEGDLVISKNKSRNKIFGITTIAELFLLIFSIMVLCVTSDTGETNAAFIIITTVLGVSLLVTGIVFLNSWSQGKEAAKNMIKQVEFYSNCLVIVTTSDKYVINIPQIARIFIAPPNRANPQGFRKLKILNSNGTKTEINMGKLNSKRGYEIFGCYEQFFIDIHTWAANHGIICVNDISA